MSEVFDPRPQQAWLPIADAPRDGTHVLLLYPSGRVALGCWQHTVRTTNGKVVYDRADWSTDTALPGFKSGAKPIYFAPIPELPPRDEQGYVIAASEAPHA